MESKRGTRATSDDIDWRRFFSRTPGEELDAANCPALDDATAPAAEERPRLAPVPSASETNALPGPVPPVSRFLSEKEAAAYFGEDVRTFRRTIAGKVHD